jgi:hypothetical protein
VNVKGSARNTVPDARIRSPARTWYARSTVDIGAIVAPRTGSRTARSVQRRSRVIKPTLLPFAFFGANHREWWVALAAAAAATMLFAPMWPDYVGAVLNARDPGGLLYSVQEVPMLFAPLVAWALSGEHTLARTT